MTTRWIDRPTYLSNEYRVDGWFCDFCWSTCAPAPKNVQKGGNRSPGFGAPPRAVLPDRLEESFPTWAPLPKIPKPRNPAMEKPQFSGELPEGRRHPPAGKHAAAGRFRAHPHSNWSNTNWSTDHGNGGPVSVVVSDRRLQSGIWHGYS